jgi:hypothetical protein
MALFNLDTTKASEASERREAINGLKPVGFYCVKAEKVHFFGETGKTPALSFELKIVGLLKDDGETFAAKKDGSKVYANSRLFFRAFISEAALFNLENIMVAMGAEALKGEALAKKLNSFSSVPKLLAWVNTWLDTDEEFIVYVNHDLKGKKPIEKVHFQNV